MEEIGKSNGKNQPYLNKVKLAPILVSSNWLSIHLGTEKHPISKCRRDFLVFSKWSKVVSDLVEICTGPHHEVALIPGRL